MSAKTTHSPVGMDCDRVEREEILEGYLAGTLTDEDMDAFEEHYFECARCFADLRSVEAIRAELQRTADTTVPNRRWFTLWVPAAGIAATVALASAVMIWMYLQPSSVPPQAIATTTPPPMPTSEPSAPQTTPSIDSRRVLQELARVEPAPYDPLTFRGVQDQATTRFLRGMEAYRHADYRSAVIELRRAEELEPDAAHICFFLGVSHLLTGDDTSAIDRLRATIALGDSPYLEEAHLYLARAFLRQRNVAAAETQLKQLIALGGSSGDEARRFLAQLERLQKR